MTGTRHPTWSGRMRRVDDDTTEALVLLGLDRAEAERAVREDRVALALVSRLLAADRVFSAAEVAERIGVPKSYLRERDRALGLPSTMGYSQLDVEELQPLAELLQLVSQEAVLRGIRNDAQSLTRIAMSNLELVNAEIAEPLREQGGGDVVVALALAEAARALLPATVPLLSASFRRILTHLLSTEIVEAASRGADTDISVAVGFVDVVGYTSLSARIDPHGLDDVLEAFESRAYACASHFEKVQLVKFLGDAAMFIAVEPQQLALTLLELVTEPDADSPLADAPMRGGMACGSVLPRGGDYFGPPVNLAARLTDHARPGTVLADEQLGESLDGLHLRRVPPMRLRGLGFRRPLRVRRPELDD